MSGIVTKGITLQKLTKIISQTQGKQLYPILFLRSYYTAKTKPKRDENYLSKHLYNKIKATGPITLADYMKEVLQNPARGYYMCKDMLGEAGDFITSPEISQIFGEMIAVWFLNEWNKVGSPRPVQLVELGPGRGTLSADILKVFNHFKALHKASLHLVEISPVLSEIQSKTLCVQSNLTNNPKNSYYRAGITSHGIPVYWYRQFKDVPEGFTLLLAHEFFDALPIHKFHKTYAGYKEVLIDIDTAKIVSDQPSEVDSFDFKFRYVLSRNDTPMLKVLLKPNETREHVEISPESMLIYEQICNRVVSNGGIVLICDYGHDGTGTDSFRAFKGHKQVDPLVYPGTADLTADVDFNIIREVANKNGDIIYLGPVKQRTFLNKIGIQHRVKALTESLKDPVQIENLKECYKFLTDDTKMGERFKFCALLPLTLKKILDKFPVIGF